MAKENSTEAADTKLAKMFAAMDALKQTANQNIEAVEFDVEKMTMDVITRWLNAHQVAKRGGLDYDALAGIFAEVVVDAPAAWGSVSDAGTYRKLDPASWKLLDERFAAVVNYVTTKN